MSADRPELDLTPEQPPEIAAAIAAAIGNGAVGPDPWWQAGIDEALGDQGDAAMRPRRTLGADLA